MIRRAADEIRADLMQVTGLYSCPESPEDSINAYPALTVYAKTGRAQLGSAGGGRRNVGDQMFFADVQFIGEIHVSRIDQRIAYEQVEVMIDQACRILMQGFAADRFNDSILELKEIRFELGKMVWGADTNFGIRFHIETSIESEAPHE